jgi:predicted lipid-binding transport protein (Tim44 family)
MPEIQVIAIVAASLVVGVFVAPALGQLFGWVLKTTGSLLLMLALVAVVWLAIRPDDFRAVSAIGSASGPSQAPQQPTPPAAPAPAPREWWD